MQGTVHTYTHETGSGSVLMDNGREVAFSREAFAVSGLRHLRAGQRVSLEVGQDGAIDRLWIIGIGTGQIIH